MESPRLGHSAQLPQMSSWEDLTAKLEASVEAAISAAMATAMANLQRSMGAPQLSRPPLYRPLPSKQPTSLSEAAPQSDGFPGIKILPTPSKRAGKENELDIQGAKETQGQLEEILRYHLQKRVLRRHCQRYH